MQCSKESHVERWYHPWDMKGYLINNTSSAEPLRLYTLYAPPNHKDGTIHKTRAEAAEEEHFDGVTSE